ncbi:MAG TPA: hypothetical protein VIF62_29640 [Labilithrix sp.]
MHRVRSGSVVALLSLVACGGAAASSSAKLAPKEPFTSREAMQQIAVAKPKPVPHRDVSVVKEWTVDPRDVASAVEPKLADLAGRDPGYVLTPELRCIARELARFVAEHKTSPDERLRRFISVACGSQGEGVEYRTWGTDAATSVTDDQIFASMRGKIDLPANAKGKPAGAWLARANGRVSLVLALGGRAQPDLVIEQADADGRVAVHGEVHGPVEQIFGLINQTDRGVSRCDADPNVALPKYALVCTMAPEDKVAWVEVESKAPGRVLLHSAGVGLARRDVNEPLVYTAARDPQPVAAAADVRKAVLEGVNAARKTAGYAPLALAPKQTAMNERVAVHYFSAELNGDQDTSDKVALGLLAGWDVGGTIRNGDFFSALATGSTDAAMWLDYALESPAGRFALLDPTARQIAVGAASPEDLGGVGAVVTTYAFFENANPAAEAKEVLGRLARTRTALGAGPTTPIAGLDGLAAQARLVGEGRAEPMDALERAMRHDSTRAGRSLRGWVIATHDLESITFPAELLAKGNTLVGVEVAHWKPEGSAWGAYAIFVVTPGATMQNVAMIDQRRAAPLF